MTDLAPTELLALAEMVEESYGYGIVRDILLGEVDRRLIADVLRQAATVSQPAVRSETLPEIPDDDADFTPDLARKIIAKYQAVISMRNSDIRELSLLHGKETNRSIALEMERDQLLGVAQEAGDRAELSRQALRLLAAEDARQAKLHELLETIREQIRLEVGPEHRPDGLFKNIQDAVYAMRGRTALLNDAAITACFAAPEPVVMTGTVHNLKTWPEYFNEVLSGRKPFEWRVDDRGFKLGDTLILQEYIPNPENPGREGKYTGREITKTVSYIFSPWATNKRTVVMGLAVPSAEGK